jgi:hypothetical protein
MHVSGADPARPTCIRNLLRFWYVFRLVSMLVGVHGAADGAFERFVPPVSLLLLLLLLLPELLTAVLLELLAPADAAAAAAAAAAVVESPAAAAASESDVLLLLLVVDVDVLAKLPHVQQATLSRASKVERYRGRRPRSILTQLADRPIWVTRISSNRKAHCGIMTTFLHISLERLGTNQSIVLNTLTPPGLTEHEQGEGLCAVRYTTCQCCHFSEVKNWPSRFSVQFPVSAKLTSTSVLITTPRSNHIPASEGEESRASLDQIQLKYLSKLTF